jgi:hypothetical protein
MRIENPFVPKLSNEHISYKWIPENKLKDIKLSSAIRDIIPFLNSVI